MLNLNSPRQWPSQGETDIIEFVNESKNNQFTLHTTGGDVAGTSDFKGIFGDVTNCDASNGGQGCGILDHHGTAGIPLNDGDGGVWATLWNAEGWSERFSRLCLCLCQHLADIDS